MRFQIRSTRRFAAPPSMLSHVVQETVKAILVPSSLASRLSVILQVVGSRIRRSSPAAGGTRFFPLNHRTMHPPHRRRTVPHLLQKEAPDRPQRSACRQTSIGRVSSRRWSGASTIRFVPFLIARGARHRPSFRLRYRWSRSRIARCPRQSSAAPLEHHHCGRWRRRGHSLRCWSSHQQLSFTERMRSSLRCCSLLGAERIIANPLAAVLPLKLRFARLSHRRCRRRIAEF
jgi:hypothetical protein